MAKPRGPSVGTPTRPGRGSRVAGYPCALSSAASTIVKPSTTAHPAILSGCGPTHSIAVRRGLRR
jgi:hypothetical protein